MEENSGPLEVVQRDGGPEITLTGREVTGLVPPGLQPPPTAADLIAKLDEIGASLRELVIVSKRLPRVPGLEPHQDQARSLALAQAHLQTGFMWMRRSIEAPKVF